MKNLLITLVVLLGSAVGCLTIITDPHLADCLSNCNIMAASNDSIDNTDCLWLCFEDDNESDPPQDLADCENQCDDAWIQCMQDGG